MNLHPKKIHQPVAVDLFCGGGGLTVGLKKAGFTVAAAVEIEPAAASTFQINHPGTKLFIQDIRHVSGKDLLGPVNTIYVFMVMG